MNYAAAGAAERGMMAHVVLRRQGLSPVAPTAGQADPPTRVRELPGLTSQPGSALFDSDLARVF